MAVTGKRIQFIGLAALVLSLLVHRPAAATVPEPLLDALSAGGYVLVFRNAHADRGVDRTPLDFRNCANQRQLSSAGWKDSRAIGRALRAMGVPVASVIASPYCRTRHTAYLAFSADYVKHDDRLASDCRLPEHRRAVDALLSHAGDPLRRGTNRAIFVEDCVIDSAIPDLAGTCGGPLGSAEAVILRPGEAGSAPAVVGCLGREDWWTWQSRPARGFWARLLPYQD